MYLSSSIYICTETERERIGTRREEKKAGREEGGKVGGREGIEHCSKLQVTMEYGRYTQARPEMRELREGFLQAEV